MFERLGGGRFFGTGGFKFFFLRLRLGIRMFNRDGFDVTFFCFLGFRRLFLYLRYMMWLYINKLWVFEDIIGVYGIMV